jgi:hypothetical protein
MYTWRGMSTLTQDNSYTNHVLTRKYSRPGFWVLEEGYFHEIETETEDDGTRDDDSTSGSDSSATTGRFEAE